MKNKKIIIGAVLAVILIAIVIGLSLNGSNPSTQLKPGVESEESVATQEVSTDDPIDVVLDFYGEWLDALQSTTTDPYQLGIVNEPLLGQDLRAKLAEPLEAGVKDPVLCQDSVPTKLNSKQLYETPEEVQISVFSREQPMAGQAIVTVASLNEGWYIKDISCSREFDEPREFTFETEGNLLKSVPPPYDSNFWHIVYAQNGTQGYAAPLFFSEESVCTDSNGTESVCDTSKFTEAEKVMVQGNMSESGVDVVQLNVVQALD